MKIDERTYIVKKNKKYAVYSLLEKKRLTKFYDSIEKIDENIYIAKDEKSKKNAFLSSGFSTKNIYKKIIKILDQDINQNIYIGIKEDGEIELLTQTDKINIRELGSEEYTKIKKLLLKIT